MHRIKMIGVLAVSAALTGCSTTPETVIEYREPECTVPPKPAFDPPSWDDLLIPFSWIDSGHEDWRAYDDALTDLEDYEADLVDYTLELRALAESVCGDATD